MSSYNSGAAGLSINRQPKHNVLNPSTSNSVILGRAGPDRNINSDATVVALIDQSINTPFWGLIYFSLLSYDCCCFFVFFSSVNVSIMHLVNSNEHRRLNRSSAEVITLWGKGNTFSTVN